MQTTIPAIIASRAKNNNFNETIRTITRGLTSAQARFDGEKLYNAVLRNPYRGNGSASATHANGATARFNTTDEFYADLESQFGLYYSAIQ